MFLFVYCAGGIGRETYDIAKRGRAQAPQWQDVYFIDDSANEYR